MRIHGRDVRHRNAQRNGSGVQPWPHDLEFGCAGRVGGGRTSLASVGGSPRGLHLARSHRDEPVCADTSPSIGSVTHPARGVIPGLAVWYGSLGIGRGCAALYKVLEHAAVRRFIAREASHAPPAFEDNCSSRAKSVDDLQARECSFVFSHDAEDILQVLDAWGTGAFKTTKRVVLPRGEEWLLQNEIIAEACMNAAQSPVLRHCVRIPAMAWTGHSRLTSFGTKQG